MECEFARLVRLFNQWITHLEEALRQKTGGDQEAAALFAEKNGLLAATEKLTGLFSELLALRKQLPSAATEEDAASLTETDLEIIEHYFKKRRELGMPLLQSGEPAKE